MGCDLHPVEQELHLRFFSRSTSVAFFGGATRGRRVPPDICGALGWDWGLGGGGVLINIKWENKYVGGGIKCGIGSKLGLGPPEMSRRTSARQRGGIGFGGGILGGKPKMWAGEWIGYIGFRWVSLGLVWGQFRLGLGSGSGTGFGL